MQLDLAVGAPKHSSFRRQAGDEVTGQVEHVALPIWKRIGAKSWARVFSSCFQ